MPVCGIRWIYTLGYRCCNASGIMHGPKRSSNHPLLQAGRAALGRHCSLTAVLHLLWASGWDEVSPRASTALSVVFHACKVSSKWGCSIITGAQPPMYHSSGESCAVCLHLIGALLCVFFLQLQHAWRWVLVGFTFPTSTSLCRKGQVLYEKYCSQAARPCLQAAGSLNFNFLMTFFLALKLSGSITHFLLLFLLKFAINSLASWKASRETGTTTWVLGHFWARLPICAHQHLPKTEPPVHTILTPSFLKPLCSLINLLSVSPAALISSQYIEVHPLLLFIQLWKQLYLQPSTSHLTLDVPVKVLSLFTNTLDLPSSPCYTFHVLCSANSADLRLDL